MSDGGDTSDGASCVIRPLDAADIPLFQPLRLEALRLHPEAFGASVEEELAEGSARMIGCYPSVTLGAFAGAALVGCAGLLIPARVKRRHYGDIVSVFVTPAWRSRGVARALLDRLLQHARHVGLRHVTLSVTVGNQAARALYRAMGFMPIGVEPDGLMIDGIPYDEERMMLRL